MRFFNAIESFNGSNKNRFILEVSEDCGHNSCGHNPQVYVVMHCFGFKSSLRKLPAHLIFYRMIFFLCASGLS